MLLVLVVAGCATTSPPAPVQRAAADDVPTASLDLLNAVLWVQTSVIYDAVAVQSYALATRLLDEALDDPTWTASVEQQAMAGYEELPPAVVLDVDETVLDNSAFEARLILDGETFDSDKWNDWVREAAATAVPGSVAFTRRADSLGVTVIYVTNRDAVVEDATRRNLEVQGFPVSDRGDVVLTRGERSAWNSSDKTPRRETVAATYRILLQVGDNVGDFVADVEEPPAERKKTLARYENYWGSKWIALPNPQYGAWNDAAIGFDYSAPAAVQLRRKLESLRHAR